MIRLLLLYLQLLQAHARVPDPWCRYRREKMQILPGNFKQSSPIHHHPNLQTEAAPLDLNQWQHIWSLPDQVCPISVGCHALMKLFKVCWRVPVRQLWQGLWQSAGPDNSRERLWQEGGANKSMLLNFLLLSSSRPCFIIYFQVVCLEAGVTAQEAFLASNFKLCSKGGNPPSARFRLFNILPIPQKLHSYLQEVKRGSEAEGQ